MTQSSALKPGLALADAMPHLRVASAFCPLCDQALPLDRLEEMQRQIASREEAQMAMITARLQKQFAREKSEALDQAREEAAARENVVRQEGAAQAKVEADEKILAAEKQLYLLQESRDAELARRTQELREAFELDKAAAVNAEKAAAFEERLKLSTKVDELQRSIDKKTAEELGDGAEIDLFEALKAEFVGDRIERVKRGLPGADILHVVVHNGKDCGTIIYDSKNHNAWRNDFVTQLAGDQLAAKADFAILSTRKFPAGARYIHVQDGVIVVTPTSAVVLAGVVRGHIVQTHALRFSNDARGHKTTALYRFITSERCRDLFRRIDSHAEVLLDLQDKEIKAHQATWKRQGELARSIQKVGAEVCNEIDIIIGTADTYAEVGNE